MLSFLLGIYHPWCPCCLHSHPCASLSMYHRTMRPLFFSLVPRVCSLVFSSVSRDHSCNHYCCASFALGYSLAFSSHPCRCSTLFEVQVSVPSSVWRLRGQSAPLVLPWSFSDAPLSNPVTGRHRYHDIPPLYSEQCKSAILLIHAYAPCLRPCQCNAI